MDIISNLSQATPFMYPHFKIYIENKTIRYSLGQILNLLILDEAAKEMSANQQTLH